MNLNDINILRKNIDDIDKNIVLLIAKRKDIVAAIGNYKKQFALPVLDKKREEEIKAIRNKLALELNIDTELVNAIFYLLTLDAKLMQLNQ